MVTQDIFQSISNLTHQHLMTVFHAPDEVVFKLIDVTPAFLHLKKKNNICHLEKLGASAFRRPFQGERG